MSKEYWSPSLQKYWPGLDAVRPDFPNVSLPENMDMPEIDVYQIWYPDPWPEAEPGFTINWLEEFELDITDNKYYRVYQIVPRPDPAEE